MLVAGVTNASKPARLPGSALNLNPRKLALKSGLAVPGYLDLSSAATVSEAGVMFAATVWPVVRL